MILIGQYDSPFVRRVAVALRLYGIAYEHRPWSTFGEGDRIATFNPLRRVPTLVLDDGEVLIESGAILDWLDEQVGEARALMPRSGVARRQALQLCALATGLGDKAVSLVYERVLHETTSPVWQARCETQIGAVLDVLERDRAGRTALYWFGETIGHGDIAVACVLRFLFEAHPGLLDATRWPKLAVHAARCERLPAFQAVVQVFIPPR
jgi:glutathione S-transferase